MPEVDEFGIPIKKTSTPVDEFGIPIKKKDGGEPKTPISTSQYLSPLPQEELPLGIPQQKRSVSQEAQAAREKINKRISESDDILTRLIRENRLSAFETQQQAIPQLSEFVNPAAQSAKRFLITQSPVSPDEVIAKKQEALSDNNTARQVISRIAKKDPTIASSAYLVDAQSRANAKKEDQILSNADKIAKGELTYNINKGILQQPQGAIESGIRGFKERSRQLEDYEKIVNATNPQDKIKILEEGFASYDPDKPVPVPEGASAQFTEMLGMEGVPMIKSATAATITGLIPGAQPAIPLVAAFAASPEYYKRSYESAIRSTYYELRKRGKSPEEALAVAEDQAQKEGVIGAAEGAVSSALGARIGFKPASIVQSPVMKGALEKAIIASGNTIKQMAPEAAADAGAAGLLQVASNIAARDNGLDRGVFDGVQESIAGEVGFTIGMGILTKGGRRLVDPNTYRTILNGFARQPKAAIDEKVGEMVVTGAMTPEDAAEVIRAIELERGLDSQIPKTIPEAVRPQVSEMIEKRNELKQQLASANEAFHPTIKEEIKSIDQQILSYATNQSQVQEGRTEGDLGQPQGIVQGQPEVGQGAGSQGQAEVTTANVGDSNISGQGQVVAPELSNIERLTPDQIEVTEDATGFADQMASAQASLGSTGVSVTPYTQESYDEIASQGGKFLRAVGNKVLAVLKPNGEMVSLVKDASVKAKGAAQALITKMKDMGGLFMDNYDIYLTPIYEKAGYKVVARVPFDEQYAPEGWNNEDSPLKNKPDVVFMVREDIAPEQAQTFQAYEDAQGYVQGIVNSAVQSGKATLPKSTMVEELLNEVFNTPIEKVRQSLAPTGVDIQVVSDPAEYDAQVEKLGGQRGTEGVFLSNEGKIILNEQKLKEGVFAGRIIWHEASHPVMNIIRNTNPDLYNRVLSGLKQVDNPAVKQAIQWANENYKGQGTIDDESIVETVAMVADGTLDLESIPTGLKQSIIDFINLLARALGFNQVLNDTDVAAFKKLAGQIADALTSGRDIAQVVGKENVKEYMSNLESPELVGGGSVNIQPRTTESPAVNVYESKETEKLPKRSLQEVYDQYEGKAVVINSDPTRVGELTLPSGKKIFMYGGPGYLSLKDNVNGNVGFATTQIGKVNTWMKYVNELFGGKPGVTLVATQAPTSILSNSYALRYVMDGISQLPKSVLRSSDFKNEFFGKDLVLLKDAFGEKAYNEFVNKYKKADLSNPTVIDGMISEMAYKVGDDNKPASFKARGAFVSNLLGGIEAKKKLKTVEGDAGYVSKKPTKYISGQLFNRLGINAEKVIREIGEPSLVDLYMNEGKWGMAVSGFETDPAMTVDAVQEGGVKHPLFNAKFPGKNPFVLDGAYDVNEMFSPIEMTGPSGAPYTKTAGQMLAGSMYVKGQPTKAEGSFEYQATPAVGGAIQASAGGRDLAGKIANKLTDDGQGNYVFFHYSGKKLNKIDPSKFGANLATGRDERPGVGISMYYVDNKTLETGVPSDFGYAVRIPKDKVYPFNEDPLNFYDQAKVEFEKDYPGQAFDANKQIGYITKIANDNGFDITVADWNIKGRKALRAQTTKSLKPEVYKQKVFKNGSEREQFNEELQKLKPGVQASVGNRLAPNGKPSNLTEQQYNQVRTPEFKNWFGDWENDPDSKILDENGEPKVLYHGSKNIFDIFKAKYEDGMVFLTTNPEFAAKWMKGVGGIRTRTTGESSYEAFRNESRAYMEKNPMPNDDTEYESWRANDPGRFSQDADTSIYPVFSNATMFDPLNDSEFQKILPALIERYGTVDEVNKMIAQGGNRANWFHYENKIVKDALKKLGYTGIWLSEKSDSNAKAETAAIFGGPNQIKSATGNVGTFSTTDNRIQASVGNRPENNTNFKLGAFVMRKKAEGATDGEIAIAIASVTGMKPEDIKTLIDNPEQYIRDMFPSMTKLQQDNLIQKAKTQNIYRGRQFGKPIDKAFTGLEVPQEYIDEYMQKTAKSDNAVKEWATDFKRKWLDPAKGLPDWVLAIKDFASGSKNIEIARAAKTIERLKDEAKKIGFSDWDAFGKALVVAKDVKRYIPNEDGVVPFDAYRAAAGKMFTTPDDMLPAIVPDEIKALPDEIIPYVYAMRGQIDNLTRDLIGFGYVTPEQAVNLEKNIGSYVNRSYRMFNEMGYKPEPEVKNAAIKFLADDYVKEIATDKAGTLSYKQAYDEAIQKAEKDVEAILNKKRNPYFNASVDRRNTGILQERQDIPEPLRKLMGEYTDPGTVFMMTVAKQAALKGSSQYLSKLRENGMGTLFFEKDDPSRPLSHSVQIAAAGTESMNPLGGLYTTPEIAEAIDMAEPTYNNLTQAWMKLVGAVRWGKTVGSIATQFKNLESNLGFAVLNGYLMSGSNTQAFKASNKYRKGQYSKEEIDAITDKVIRLNLVGQSVGARELKEMLGSGDIDDIALDIALSPEGKWGKKVSKRLNIFKQANKLYRLGDDLWKVYAYVTEREQLSDARFSSKYEDLTKEQQDQIDVESSERVKNTWPTYDRVVEGAKLVSKSAPIFGNFISFQAESLRVLANSIKLAKQDMADPQLRHLGVRRAVGIAAYFGLRSAITIGLAKTAGFAAAGILGAAFGDDEEERNKRAIRQALPPFMRTSDLAVKETNEPHKFTVISLSSLDPYGIIPNSLNALTEGREGLFGRTMEPGVLAAGTELLSGFLEPEMTFETMWSVRNNIDPKTGQQIIMETDNNLQSAAKVASAVWGQLEPSTISMIRRLYERKDKEAEILALGGARPYDVDLHKSFGYILSQFGKDVDAINREYNSLKYRDIPQNEKNAAEMAAEDKKAFAISKLNETYRDFINLGADPKVLNELINQRSSIKMTGFDKNTKKFIKTGKINKQSLFK